jgi:hypothetical protein
LTWAPFFPKENPFVLFTIPPPSKVLSSMMRNFTQKKSKICDHHDAWVVELQAPNCLEALEFA